MNGVNFGEYHSWDDFSLVLSPQWENEAPSPKMELIDIPGGDGVLDLTEAFGTINYNNRKLTFPFTVKVPRSEFWEVFSKIQNAIHGKKMKIIMDDDLEFYYIGRVTVDKWRADKNIGVITITCDCEPYKYKVHDTVVKNTVSDSAILYYENLKKMVIPEITLTEDAIIKFNGGSYAFEAGTSKTENIMFSEGINKLEVIGTTTITVTYREGGL